MITKQEFVPGKVYFYSDMYDRKYAKIKAIKINRVFPKRGIFTFDAKMVDNTHMDNKESFNKLGTVHSYSNSFIYKSFAELVKDSNKYKQTLIRLAPAIILSGQKHKSVGKPVTQLYPKMTTAMKESLLKMEAKKYPTLGHLTQAIRELSALYSQDYQPKLRAKFYKKFGKYDEQDIQFFSEGLNDNQKSLLLALSGGSDYLWNYNIPKNLGQIYNAAKKEKIAFDKMFPYKKKYKSQSAENFFVEKGVGNSIIRKRVLSTKEIQNLNDKIKSSDSAANFASRLTDKEQEYFMTKNERFIPAKYLEVRTIPYRSRKRVGGDYVIDIRTGKFVANINTGKEREEFAKIGYSIPYVWDYELLTKFYNTHKKMLAKKLERSSKLAQRNQDEYFRTHPQYKPKGYTPIGSFVKVGKGITSTEAGLRKLWNLSKAPFMGKPGEFERYEKLIKDNYISAPIMDAIEKSKTYEEFRTMLESFYRRYPQSRMGVPHYKPATSVGTKTIVREKGKWTWKKVPSKKIVRKSVKASKKIFHKPTASNPKYRLIGLKMQNAIHHWEDKNIKDADMYRRQAAKIIATMKKNEFILWQIKYPIIGQFFVFAGKDWKKEWILEAKREIKSMMGLSKSANVDRRTK